MENEIILKCNFAIQTGRCNGHPCCIHKCQPYDSQTKFGLRDDNK